MYMLQAINRGVVMVNFYDCYVADCETQNVTNQAVVGKYISRIDRASVRGLAVALYRVSHPIIHRCFSA